VGKKITDWIARAWPVVRAVLGVIGAAAFVALCYAVAIRIRRNLGGYGKGQSSTGSVIDDNRAAIESARKVQQSNAEAIAQLNAAMDTLRNARNRPGR
jgi:hypothetical protein